MGNGHFFDSEMHGFFTQPGRLRREKHCRASFRMTVVEWMRLW